MRIALRPSGGRGDYELAGSFNRIHASDLLGKRFFFQVTPGLTIDGKAAAHRLSGKPRIRPEGGRHAYVVVSSVLLLPPPRRELLKTPEAVPQLRANGYTIAGIDVAVLDDEPAKVTFAPKSVWARSRGGLLQVDYTARMAMVTALWCAAASIKSEVAGLVREHKASVESGDHDRIADSAAAIQAHYQTQDDVMPLLLRDSGLPDAASPAFTGVSSETGAFESEEDDSSPDDSRRERARKWRRQADRGPGAREFSIRVRKAYDYRCVFSGERFPKLSVLDSAGVDGAHILPWSTHELNAVSNGLCLCKLCHWAFDSGLLRLDFDGQSRDQLSVPAHVQAVAVPAKFDLMRFQKMAGRIDPSRFPRNQKLWPAPKNLQELNAG